MCYGTVTLVIQRHTNVACVLYALLPSNWAGWQVGSYFYPIYVRAV